MWNATLGKLLVIAIASSGYMTAFDGSNGQIVWATNLGTVTYSTPLVSNGVLYIGMRGGKRSFGGDRLASQRKLHGVRPGHLPGQAHQRTAAGDQAAAHLGDADRGRAAPVADERLIGDFGSALTTLHRGHDYRLMTIDYRLSAIGYRRP